MSPTFNNSAGDLLPGAVSARRGKRTDFNCIRPRLEIELMEEGDLGSRKSLRERYGSTFRRFKSWKFWRKRYGSTFERFGISEVLAQEILINFHENWDHGNPGAGDQDQLEKLQTVRWESRWLSDWQSEKGSTGEGFVVVSLSTYCFRAEKNNTLYLSQLNNREEGVALASRAEICSAWQYIVGEAAIGFDQCNGMKRLMTNWGVVIVSNKSIFMQLCLCRCNQCVAKVIFLWRINIQIYLWPQNKMNI